MSEVDAVAGLAGQALSMVTPPVSMSHHFRVHIDNMAYNLGGWSRAAGLTVNWQQLEHREGDQGNYVQYLPGATKYEPITLSRAATFYSRIVQSWLCKTSLSPRPLSGTIQLVTFTGVPVVEWRLQEFFPIGWSIESFDAGAAKPAIETLKLAHTGFLQDDLSPGSLPVPPTSGAF